MKQYFENSQEAYKVDSAFPFTLCRGFFTPKIWPVPPKNDEAFFMLLYIEGTKIRNKTRCTPNLRPGRVAQSVGHLTRKSGVLGSVPGLATCFGFSFRFFKKGSCQLLAKVCARSTG